MCSPEECTILLPKGLYILKEREEEKKKKKRKFFVDKIETVPCRIESWC